jgi:hypothetical protein
MCLLKKHGSPIELGIIDEAGNTQAISPNQVAQAEVVIASAVRSRAKQLINDEALKLQFG